MILHRNHRGFGVEGAIGVAQPEDVAELQWRRACKQNFPRGAEFNDRTFLHDGTDGLAVTTGVTAAGELDGNSNRRGLGKKASQFGDRAGLRRPRWSCAVLRQTMPTFPVLYPYALFTG